MATVMVTADIRITASHRHQADLLITRRIKPNPTANPPHHSIARAVINHTAKADISRASVSSASAVIIAKMKWGIAG